MGTASSWASGGDGAHTAAALLMLLLGATAAAQFVPTAGGGGGGTGEAGAAAAVGASAGAGAGAGARRCGDEHLACVRMAGPLLTHANLIFPDNMADVNKLCTRWREFVACVKAYTGRCFSLAQQEEFVRAVQSPLGLAHRLCSEMHYQTEYLEYAVCIHSTVTGNGHCSALYNQLVDRVLGEVDEKTLCCSHRHFEDCVLDEVGRICSSPGKSDAVKTFAQDLLDKAFNYIQTKCSGSHVYMHDCPPRRLEPSNRAFNRTDLSGRGAGSGGGGGGDAGRPLGDTGAQQPRTNHIPALPHPGDEEGQSPWQPGKALDTGPHMLPNPPEVTDTMARANPDRLPSHGRGINWTPGNSHVPGPDSVPGATAGAPSGVHDNVWTVSSSNVPPHPQSPNPTHVWYPWGKLNNAVDEPNQQGLAGSDMSKENAASTCQLGVTLLVFSFTAVLFI